MQYRIERIRVQLVVPLHGLQHVEYHPEGGGGERAREKVSHALQEMRGMRISGTCISGTYRSIPIGGGVH
jgi:hypothetical protein